VLTNFDSIRSLLIHVGREYRVAKCSMQCSVNLLVRIADDPLCIRELAFPFIAINFLLEELQEHKGLTVLQEQSVLTFARATHCARHVRHCSYCHAPDDELETEKMSKLIWLAHVPSSLPALSSVSFNHFTERARLEIQVALDREAKRPARFRKLGEHEIPPFLFEATDVAEE
jgi:hypothetical protein